MSADEKKLREWLEEREKAMRLIGDAEAAHMRNAFNQTLDWLDDNASPAPEGDDVLDPACDPTCCIHARRDDEYGLVDVEIEPGDKGPCTLTPEEAVRFGRRLIALGTQAAPEGDTEERGGLTEEQARIAKAVRASRVAPAISGLLGVLPAGPSDTETVTLYEQAREIVDHACVSAAMLHGVGDLSDSLARVLADIDALRPAISTEGGEDAA